MDVFQKYGGKKQLACFHRAGCPQLRRQPEVTGVDTKCGVSSQGKRTLTNIQSKRPFSVFWAGQSVEIVI